MENLRRHALLLFFFYLFFFYSRLVPSQNSQRETRAREQATPVSSQTARPQPRRQLSTVAPSWRTKRENKKVN